MWLGACIVDFLGYMPAVEWMNHRSWASSVLLNNVKIFSSEIIESIYIAIK
jgi:hypothetical protein